MGYTIALLVGLVFWSGVPKAAAHDGPMKVEVVLVWGTSDSTSPDPKHRPVDPDIDKKLKKLFRWTNYFEVSRKLFTVPETGITNVAVSDKCSVEVRRLTGSSVEVGYIGKGKPVERRILVLPRDKPLIYGGEAPNATAWFVILRRLE